MVNFGKKLLENRFEPWAEHYLDYQGLKRCLERKKRRKSAAALPPPPPSDAGSYYPQLQQYAEDASDFGSPPYGSPHFRGGTPESHNKEDGRKIHVDGTPGDASGSNSPNNGRGRTGSWSEQTWTTIATAADTRDFETYLEDEVEKIGLFFLQVQGEIAADIADLRKQQTALQKQDWTHSNYSGDDAPAPMPPRIISRSQQQERYSSAPEPEGMAEENAATNRGANPSLFQLYADYHALAELLLHLVHFVEVNVTGIRKILKKHDKNTHKHLTYQYISFPRGKYPQLKHLWTSLLLHQYEGITALFTTLKVALQELKHYEDQQHQLQYFKAQIPNHQKQLSMPNVTLTPSELAQATAAAGALMSSTGPTSYQRTFTPQALSNKQFYHDKPNSQYRSSETDYTGSARRDLDAVLLKVESARKRLNASSNTFQDMLAAQIMVEPDMEGEDDEEEDEEEERQKRVDDKWFSHLLNLGSTFFYMTNYYVVAPTSGDYAKMLGGDEALAGIIIGMTPIAALVSTVLYSWWTSHSYKAALLFASTCSLVGNLCYALALPCNSLAMVMIGRLLNGFGSARSINRRYIADTFPPRERTVASAHFVTAGALGMAAGPALASVLHIGSHKINTTNDDGVDTMTVIDAPLSSPSFNVWWTPENSPGWFMFIVWATFWILLWFYFEDPPKHGNQSTSKQATKTLELTKDAHNTNGEKQALLKSKVSDGDEADEVNHEDFMEDSDQEDEEVPLWRNIPVMTTFAIYFVLKLVLECLLSSTSTLTHYYFGWDSSISGIYLTILGLLMLPANLGIAMLARNHDDRQLIVFCEVLMLVGCCGIIRYSSEASYSPIQYVLFSIIIFLSTNALEGPNMSLLSQTIPKSWSRGIFNVGLLATEAGTLGRAISDVLLSLWSFHGIGSLLNDAFRNMSLASAAMLAMTYYFFGHMETNFKED